MTLQFGPLAARRLGMLRGIDPETHAALLSALPELADCLSGKDDVALLADLLAQVAAEAPDAALALATRLTDEPAAVADLTGLRKWCLYGLQRHRDETVRRLHFFERADPLVFTDRSTESDTVHLLGRREALLHYLVGFGVTDRRIELHEPQASALLPPSVSIVDAAIKFPRRYGGIAAAQPDMLYRAAIAHAAAHLRHSPSAQPAGSRQPMLLAVLALIEDARVERLMTLEFPGLRALWSAFHTASRETSGFEFSGLAARLARALHDPSYTDVNAWVVKGRQLFENAAGADLFDLATFEKIGRSLAIDIEKMRLSLPRDYRVQPAYGTNADFKRLVGLAHRRGIRILVDMVLNHASSEHPSFQAALRDSTSPYRAWYRFSPTQQGKGPWGAEAWHRSPVLNEYYYGVFWKGMPDLNYETPAVREEAKKVATFWLRDMGVDGFRLDAVPYLVEEGSCLTGCAGTHAFLREYAAHVRSISPGAYTVGEVWGNSATLLPYYPDQLTSYFAFELADSLLSAIRHGRAAGLLGGFLRLQDTLPAYRWSPLLSNHDGTRSMTVLGGDVPSAKLAGTLLLTLPGLPFVYYGEEIGMTGDKPDERLRTPMQWRPGRGVGFTAGTPWESPQPDAPTVNVEAQDTAAGSLLNRYRRLIHLRGENEALASGRLVPLTASSPQVAAYLRRAGAHAVLVVANLAAAAVSGISISSAPDALPPGRYLSRNLLGGPAGASLEVSRDGQIRGYLPLPGSLRPRESLVLDLSRRQAPRRGSPRAAPAPGLRTREG